MAFPLKFEVVPKALLELTQERLYAAMQVIAALVLTEEEALSIPDMPPDWPKQMREDLLSPQWRPNLLKILQKKEYRTNTHPGFSLTYLEDSPPGSFEECRSAFVILEELLFFYSEGEGKLRLQEDESTDYWPNKLIALGYTPELAHWVWRQEGVSTLACLAEMLRHRRSRITGE